MKIIIVGCGKVGTTLAEQLNRENHDITLIVRVLRSSKSDEVIRKKLQKSLVLEQKCCLLCLLMKI